MDYYYWLSVQSIFLFYFIYSIDHCFLILGFSNPLTAAENRSWEIKFIFIIIFPLTNLVSFFSNCLFWHTKYIILTKANACIMLKRKMFEALIIQCTPLNIILKTFVVNGLILICAIQQSARDTFSVKTSIQKNWPNGWCTSHI